MKITDFQTLQRVLEALAKEKLNGTEYRLLIVWLAQGSIFNPSLSCFSKKMCCDTSLVSKTLRSLRSKRIIHKIGHDKNRRSIYQLDRKFLTEKKKLIKKAKPERKDGENSESLKAHLSNFIQQNPEHYQIDFAKSIYSLLAKGTQLTDNQRSTIQSITKFNEEKVEAQLEKRRLEQAYSSRLNEQCSDTYKYLLGLKLSLDAKNFAKAYGDVFGFQSVEHLGEVYELYQAKYNLDLLEKCKNGQITTENYQGLRTEDLKVFCEIYKSQKKQIGQVGA